VEVIVNGQPQEIQPDTSLSDLVAQLNLPSERIAIELNKTVVRRAQWSDTDLNNGDRIEIVHFVGGGVAASSINKICRRGRLRSD
jgi:thiamine biosynthesis protein ThiS